MIRLRFLPAFILLMSVGSYGQTQEDYDFINAIIPQLKTPDVLMIQEKTYPCDLVSETQFKYYYNELHDKIDSLTFRQMFENSAQNSAVEAKWNQSHLTKKINLISSQQVISLQKANRENINAKDYCVISLPVFNHEKNYAAIDFGCGTAVNKMAGTHYLFKRKKGKWILIATFGGWAS